MVKSNSQLEACHNVQLAKRILAKGIPLSFITFLASLPIFEDEHNQQYAKARPTLVSIQPTVQPVKPEMHINKRSRRYKRG